MRSIVVVAVMALALCVPATAVASGGGSVPGSAPTAATTAPATTPSTGSVQPATQGASPADVTSQVIVTLRGSLPSGRSVDAARVRAAQQRLRDDALGLGVIPTDVYASIGRVFSASVTPAQLASLRQDPDVISVQSDDLVLDAEAADRLSADTEAAVVPASTVAIDGDVELDRGKSKVIGSPIREELPHQVVPIWLKRIGALSTFGGIGNHKTTNGFDADVAIIDSGISRNHPDVTPAGGKDCSHSGGWGDDYGHGTGVASVLGAKDNRRGIVGLLPGVRLWSVRIFDDQGRGSVSGVLCALDWIASKRDPRHRDKPFFEGATMSFSVIMSGGAPSSRPCREAPRDIIHKAVCRIVREGTILVAAAGNYGDPAKLRAPAAYPEVITVSAMADFDGKRGGRGRQSQACLAGSAIEHDDSFTSFSSYGSAVDLIAPGKCIWVAYKGGTYARVAGTSFSTPIVLAAALRYKQRYQGAKPDQVRMALIRAGRKDWLTGTDPDSRHEPRVDVRHFRPPPTFAFHTIKRRTLTRTGKAVTITLDRVRHNGYTGQVRISRSHIPTGLHVTVKGSKVRIWASSGSHTGLQRVTLHATDGEISRTIRIPLRVRRG
jgi:hypothetical protein